MKKNHFSILFLGALLSALSINGSVFAQNPQPASFLFKKAVERQRASNPFTPPLQPLNRQLAFALGNHSNRERGLGIDVYERGFDIPTGVGDFDPQSFQSSHYLNIGAPQIAGRTPGFVQLSKYKKYDGVRPEINMTEIQMYCAGMMFKLEAAVSDDGTGAVGVLKFYRRPTGTLSGPRSDAEKFREVKFSDFHNVENDFIGDSREFSANDPATGKQTTYRIRDLYRQVGDQKYFYGALGILDADGTGRDALGNYTLFFTDGVYLLYFSTRFASIEGTPRPALDMSLSTDENGVPEAYAPNTNFPLVTTGIWGVMIRQPWRNRKTGEMLPPQNYRGKIEDWVTPVDLASLLP